MVSTMPLIVPTMPLVERTKPFSVSSMPLTVPSIPLMEWMKPRGVPTMPSTVLTMPLAVSAKPFTVSSMPLTVSTMPFMERMKPRVESAMPRMESNGRSVSRCLPLAVRDRVTRLFPRPQPARECERVLDAAVVEDHVRVGGRFVVRAGAVRHDLLPFREVRDLAVDARERDVHRAGDVRFEIRVGVAHVNQRHFILCEAIVQLGDADARHCGTCGVIGMRRCGGRLFGRRSGGCRVMRHPPDREPEECNDHDSGDDERDDAERFLLWLSLAH